MGKRLKPIFGRFLKLTGHVSQVMILSNIKNSCGVCVLCATSLPTVKLSARNYDGKQSVRDGIKGEFSKYVQRSL